jgi:hypothetical protein
VADIKSEYMAGLKSESVAGFELECMADFIGIRTMLKINANHTWFRGFRQPLTVRFGITEFLGERMRLAVEADSFNSFGKYFWHKNLDCECE